MEGISALLREVNEIQSTVAATVEQQRAAADQLARSVGQAASYSRETADS
jgi:methyl-accepting chemotaxis protein